MGIFTENQVGFLINYIFLVFISFITLGFSDPPGAEYEELDNGVVVHLKDSDPSEAKSVKLEVVTPKIIHVTASAADSFFTTKSLMTVNKDRPVPTWDVEKAGNSLHLNTDSLSAHISLETGKVDFYDDEGNVILRENKDRGKNFEPVTVQGEDFYKIQQVFDSPSDEAFYGLGQHQHGQMNFKGEDVELAQHNIVAVVPFLYSSRNYGILWDNYSITNFGDPRDYKPLSSLNLFSKNGKKGGLTAKYFSDSTELSLTKTEQEVNYQYLSDLENIPEEFNMEEGKAIWEGQISADQSGTHKFLLYQSGYTKVWIDGELIVDRWRVGWNPWSEKFKIDMEAGEKRDFKMEWRPASGQAFLALKHLDPMAPKGAQQDLTLTSEVGKQIDYYFIKGNNADSVISGYRELTGKAPIVPKWAMGYWQSRERYENQDQLLETVKEYRKRDIPLDNIVLDWMYWPEDRWGSHEFDAERFPEPKKMVDQVHDMNGNIMISVWPKFYKGTEHFNEFNEKGYIFQHNLESGNKDWVGPGYLSSFYDPFSAESRDIFWNQINDHLYSKEFDAWWLDATEPDMHSNLSIEERKLNMTPTAMGPGAQYFNAFSLMNAKGIYNGQRNVDPSQRVFILTRSAYAGQQRYGAVTWSGDVVSRWSNLKEQISAGINVGLAGIPYWTTDIGGFSVEQRYMDAEGEDLVEWRELNTRWFQFGTFTPLMRSHGQYPEREIYNIAPESHPAYEAMVKYNKLRYRLMPYLYTQAAKAYHDDYTLMRGLIMDFPEDKKVHDIGTQYMFGPSILVNPVYEFKANSREVYLPESEGWYDFQSGEFLEGGQTISADAPLSEMPLYIKAGSIIPFGPSIEYYDEKPADPVTLYIYTGKDAHFELYEDENENYSYEDGAFSTIPIYYDDNSKTLTIGEREGEFPGMLQNRTFNIVWITEDGSKGVDFDRESDQTVKYSGSKITREMK